MTTLKDILVGVLLVFVIAPLALGLIATGWGMLILFAAGGLATLILKQ